MIHMWACIQHQGRHEEIKHYQTTSCSSSKQGASKLKISQDAVISLTKWWISYGFELLLKTSQEVRGSNWSNYTKKPWQMVN